MRHEYTTDNPSKETSPLEQLLREHAQVMLAATLDEEVNGFLERCKYQRTGNRRSYRNGYLPERSIGVGMAHVPVKVPRVRGLPEGLEFTSQHVRKYERQSPEQQRLLVQLYVEGLSSGDFEPVFRAFVDETAGLSASSIGRLKEVWESEYNAWRTSPLKEWYPYIYAEGIYLRAGKEHEKTAMLVIIGVNVDGEKELLALEMGYRESIQSWRDVLNALRYRGMSKAPLLSISDGGLGWWGALAEVYPSTRRQRCWNHRTLNVIDAIPKRLQKDARGEVREIWSAQTKDQCLERRDRYCTHLRTQGQEKAAACLERDWDDFVAFFDFPQEHWTHLRTTNPIESIHAGVRNRTKIAKRMNTRENAMYLVFKVVMRLSTNWRGINAPNQLQLPIACHTFTNGKLKLPPSPESKETTAA